MIDDAQEIIFVPEGDSTHISAPVLSSEVGDLEFAVDATSADIRIYHEAEPSDILVFKTSMRPRSGKCTLFQPGDIIADYMKSSALSFARFRIEETSGGSSMTYNVLLSDSSFPIGFSQVQKMPLMASPVVSVPDYAPVRFYCIPNIASTPVLTASVTGTCDDGTQNHATFQLPGRYSIDSRIIAVDVIARDLVDYINESCHLPFEFVSLQCIRIQCVCNSQYYSATIYVTDDPDCIDFYFLNNFGLLETICFHAETLPGMKRDCQSAYIGHRSVQYDCSSQLSYSLEAANIVQSDWAAVSQFLASRRIVDSLGRQILISDVSSDIGKNNSLGSLKFNYRYADDRILH